MAGLRLGGDGVGGVGGEERESLLEIFREISSKPRVARIDPDVCTNRYRLAAESNKHGLVLRGDLLLLWPTSLGLRLGDPMTSRKSKSKRKSKSRDQVSFLTERIRFMCQVANTVVNPRNTESPWLRGRMRELLLQNLLEPLVPHTCRLVTGTVVDAMGTRRRSSQDDILLIDGECLPPLFEESRHGVYPVESVLARIEVKTKLRNGELKDIIDGAHSFWRLKPSVLENEPDQDQSLNPDQIKPLQILFAFQAQPRCLESLGRLAKATFRHEHQKYFICVPQRGLWAHTRLYGKSDPWYACEVALGQNGSDPFEFQEVLSLVALMLQELPALRELKKRAALGKYVRCLRRHQLIPFPRPGCTPQAKSRGGEGSSLSLPTK